MARLHEHAASWSPPGSFSRRRWNWDGFFGTGAGLGASAEVWSLLPAAYRPLFEDVALCTRELMNSLGEGPEAWGLIHADLHANNLLLSGGQARPIDFDDCGWGYWAYDFCVALGRHVVQEDAEASASREALLRGYARHRPVPHEQLAHMKSFAAARRVALALWVVGRSRDNPTFRERLPGRLESAEKEIRQLLAI